MEADEKKRKNGIRGESYKEGRKNYFHYDEFCEYLEKSNLRLRHENTVLRLLLLLESLMLLLILVYLFLGGKNFFVK